MSFLSKAKFCANSHSQLWWLCYIIQSATLTVYCFPAHWFSSVQFSFSALHQPEQLSNLWQSLVPLQFPLPDLVIATDAMPSHWAHYCQGSRFLLSVSGSWSGPMPCKNFRQLLWCCREWIFGCLVRWFPCIRITALQKIIYSIKAVQWSPFLSRHGVPDIESHWQAQCYFNSRLHSYPSQYGSQLSVT